MAKSGDIINFASLGKSVIGNIISRNNPGANGSVFVMVSPSFACWTKTDSKPTFGTEPKMWTNFQYWNGSSWVNVYDGNSGKSTSVQLNVNYSYDTGTVTKYYNGTVTPILFQAKRLQGDGGRTHCQWRFMQQGHAGQSWYNSYMRYKEIYGLSNPTGIYVVSDGGGPAAPTMAQIQANLPLIARGTPITTNYINNLTCKPLGYTR